MDFNARLKAFQSEINNYLDKVLHCDEGYLDTIISSMRYSLFAGGKRLRPVLALGTGEIFGCPKEHIMPFAAGIEMIHTYSLIHDDLPAMDNDDYRRGKPTNHRVYGEGLAVLAGDGLLNLAFEHMLEFAFNMNDARFVKATIEIAHASGINGMIGGQAVDIQNSGKIISKDVMEYMHVNKTGALIKAPVRAAAIISGAEKSDLDRLTIYAGKLGLAFQIIDDILDVVGDKNKLGKSTGSDESNDKSTYVSMYGVEKAREIAKNLTQEALDNINYYGSRAEFLSSLTLYLLDRDY